MAYQTGTATSQQDLIQVLETFLAANGWTIDEAWDSTNRRSLFHKGTVYIGMKSSPTGGTAGVIGFWHALGYTGGQGLGQHPSDSGQGTLNPAGSVEVTTGPRISGIGDGPYTTYHFFTDAADTYCHVVLGFTPGIYRHFSFGTITKVGTWTGGEYMAAHLWSEVATNAFNNNGSHQVLWDGNGANTADAGTLHVEGMPNQGVNQKWQLMGTMTSSLGNDRQASPQARIAGPGGILNSNPYYAGFGLFRASLLNGFVPLIPIPIWWRDITPTPDHWMLLGFAPDVRHVQMGNMVPAQEFTVGGDTWKVFPVVRQQNLQQSGVQESRNLGIAYKKIAS